MSVTVLRKSRTTPPEVTGPDTEPVDWVKIAACGSLICGGLLILSGKKRAGLVAAASGTALAMVEHQDTLREWWEALPRQGLRQGRVPSARTSPLIAAGLQDQTRFPVACDPPR